jgi:hypothetical protein
LVFHKRSIGLSKILKFSRLPCKVQLHNTFLILRMGLNEN